VNVIKGVIGLVGTVVVAGWVAFAVSAPRNADAHMNQEMAALDGKSINQTIVEAKTEADAMQCETYRDLAREQWDRSVANGTIERDQSKIDEIDRQVDRFCN